MATFPRKFRSRRTISDLRSAPHHASRRTLHGSVCEHTRCKDMPQCSRPCDSYEARCSFDNCQKRAYTAEVRTFEYFLGTPPLYDPQSLPWRSCQRYIFSQIPVNLFPFCLLIKNELKLKKLLVPRTCASEGRRSGVLDFPLQPLHEQLPRKNDKRNVPWWRRWTWTHDNPAQRPAAFWWIENQPSFRWARLKFGRVQTFV